MSQSDIFITSRLRRNIEEFGPAGEAWLAELPSLIERVAEEWFVVIGEMFDGDASISWVAPASLSDGTPAVVKIGIPHRESRHEADALRVFDGRGAVRLLQASEDGAAMLLERCLPGTNLWKLKVEEANLVASEVLRRMWRPPPANSPFEKLEDLASEWYESLKPRRLAEGYDEPVVDAALVLGVELASSQTEEVLLHGDFQPFNVLAAEREPWLAIDCKPLIGDPTYDLAQYLANWFDVASEKPNPPAAMHRWVEQFAEQLSLDPARIAGWAFVKSLGWDWKMPTASLLHTVYRRFT